MATTIGSVAALYEDAELRIIRLLVDRLLAGSDAPEWAVAKLVELAAFRNHVEGIVDDATRAALNEIAGVLSRAAETGVVSPAAAEAVAAAVAGRTAPTILSRSRELDAIYRELVGNLDTMRGRILSSVESVYRDVIGGQAAPSLLTGTDSRATVIRKALGEFAARGVTGFVDAAGRSWEMATYVEMAAGTAAHRASVEGFLGRQTDTGRDLVVVSDHGGECDECRPWEGKVLSISGTSSHPDVEGTVAQARAGGLEHPGCRHRYMAWFPGVSKRPEPQGKPADYEARTRQRVIERHIRAWKRRAVVGEPGAVEKVREWQAVQRQHVGKHGLKRQPRREAVR